MKAEEKAAETNAKYMLIDVTEKPHGVKIVAVAHIREIAIMGRLMKADGREVLGPPLEGRGFSALSFQELQYLFWNTFSKTPSESYPQLIIDCLYHANLIDVDKTDIRDLEKQWSKVEASMTGAEETSTKRPKNKEGAGVQKPPKEKKAPVEKKEKDPTGRPAVTSTTGLVWIHCDTAFEKIGGKDVKALSKLVKELCEADGINPGTTSVQFGKWKKAKLSA